MEAILEAAKGAGMEVTESRPFEIQETANSDASRTGIPREKTLTFFTNINK